MNRLFMAVAVVLMFGSIGRADEPRQIDPSKGNRQRDVVWYNLRQLEIEGQGWEDTEDPYDRLPARAKDKVRGAVWSLSKNSSGLCARFVTDAPSLQVRWMVRSGTLAMSHMPATGVSGLDLYVRHGQKWKWVACARPQNQNSQAQLFSGIPAESREFLLYLPLYNGIIGVEIGIPVGSTLAKAPPRPENQAKPIVFYGTSITQGASASRPGMVHTAILGRWFDRPVINLGFSGNGRMEPEVAEFLAELDPAVYVLDCLPNITADVVRGNTPTVVKMLRKAHPDTPILLVEDRNYADAFLIASKRQRNESSQAALKEVYEQLKAEGVTGLHYLESDHLLGDDNEGTVDSSHPTDLGFMRHAEAFRKALEPLLK